MLPIVSTRRLAALWSVATAGNDTVAPPRPSSVSAQVENLAKDADVIVHSAIHPVMGPRP
jgi:hypothetical protein